MLFHYLGISLSPAGRSDPATLQISSLTAGAFNIEFNPLKESVYPLNTFYSLEVKRMSKQVAKQCCGLTFTSDSEYKEHREEHYLETACGCG